MSFPRTTKQCPFPFPGFLVSSRTWNCIQSHFNRQYWGDRIRILQDNPNPLPRCESCRSQVPEGRLSNRHYMSNKCKKGRKGASGARTYRAASRQVGSYYRSMLRPYHRWRRSNPWGRRLHSTAEIGRWYT